MQAWAGALLLVLIPTGIELSETDTFGLGNGSSGSLNLSAGETVVINSYHPVTSALTPGDSTVALGGTAGLSAGMLIMIAQLTGYSPLPSGNAGPFPLDATSVGQWELARVASVGPSFIELTAPLVQAFPAGRFPGDWGGRGNLKIKRSH